MNFPPFWARGSRAGFLAWRWSFTSLAEAQALADAAAQQVADRFRAGDFPPKHGGYYPDRPFREQVLQEMRDAKGEVAAVITRNSYGCDVLNTSTLMFVDIDLPEPKPAGGLLKRLFGKPEVGPATTPQTEAIRRLENWSRSNSEWGWRVYRTRSGLRLLATQGLVPADSPEVYQIFEALGADPLYQKLCKSQKCFRARLTPKPWRCGINKKPDRWPWLDARSERRFEQWLAEYRNASARWATCEFLCHVGNRQVDPEVQTLLKLHDSATRAESKLPLA